MNSQHEFCPHCDADDIDDRLNLEEWFWHVAFNVLLWSLLVGLTTGAAGLAFYAGVWGFVNGLGLLR